MYVLFYGMMASTCALLIDELWISKSQVWGKKKLEECHSQKVPVVEPLTLRILAVYLLLKTWAALFP